MANSMRRVRIDEARNQLRAFDVPTSQTSRRFDEIVGRFELFAQRGFKVDSLEAVTPEMVRSFVNAKNSAGEPSVATMHIRRTALRMFFRVARMHLGFDGDPTLDLVLPPKSTMAARPLTDDEIALGRSYSLHTLTVTRQPAAWALCEATAITAELGYITVDDLDLDAVGGPRVWLRGSRKREARWGLLDDWGAAQLERRASQVGTGALIYRGRGSEESQHMSCCNAIRDTLLRAGLNNEPDVQPPSITAWAGLAALEETGSIDGAAMRLGFRSLDAAARFIGFNWRG